MNIVFIGYGNMARAIAQGLKNHREYALFAAHPSAIKETDEQGVIKHSDNFELAALADVLILAIKPLQIQNIWPALSKVVRDNTLIISVAAGISLDNLNRMTQKSHPIVRAMPNTPASIGLAATPLCANAIVSAAQKDIAQAIFNCIGMSAWMHQEHQLEVLTAVSGSGPAYVFRFINALIQAAKKRGLEEDIAKTFAIAMTEGALALAKQQQGPLDELITAVTSPNGTTSAALEVFNHLGFDTLIDQAIQAACLRAEALRGDPHVSTT